MTRVFIDGHAGTTGLRIYERLSERKDIELMTLSEERRKDVLYRKEALNQADVAFLCLPDAAAKEAVELVENPDTVIIDTSTAHRTHPDWVYGLPELKGQREKIQSSKRIANPGCHATGFIALAAPLVQAGILDRSSLLTCLSLTGYSGGGKNMIAEYYHEPRNPQLDAPRMYGLTQQHKHLKEMAAVSGLDSQPAFCPVVADFYSGMEVTIPLFKQMINGTKEDVCNLYQSIYHSPIIHFDENADESGFMTAAAFAHRDDLQITVTGNDDRFLLIARFDNLGKGASGAAVQNMNIVLGIDETIGLEFGGNR